MKKTGSSIVNVKGVVQNGSRCMCLKTCGRLVKSGHAESSIGWRLLDHILLQDVDARLIYS